MNLTRTSAARRAFMILSPRALPFARHALESLLTYALEDLHLQLVTDSPADKDLLIEELGAFATNERHRWDVFSKDDLNEREASILNRYPCVRNFRDGHPCWRKITDPLLLTKDGEEMIVLDPDLYFPNKFCFEPTPDHSLLLMWQKPSCLLPAAMVDAAIKSGIALAHHVDIGVAQWRAPVDLDWLEWLLSQLRIREDTGARKSMHVEAIVWAALGMRLGGGHLPTEHWHCWRRSQLVRMLLKFGVPGHQLLRLEPFATIKCFHAGGEAKNWLHAAKQRQWLDSGRILNAAGTMLPFSEFTRAAYDRDQALKAWLRRVGYYSLFPGGAFQ